MQAARAVNPFSRRHRAPPEPSANSVVRAIGFKSPSDMALAQVRSGRLRGAVPRFDQALRMLEATAAITAAR